MERVGDASASMPDEASVWAARAQGAHCLRRRSGV